MYVDSTQPVISHLIEIPVSLEHPFVPGQLYRTGGGTKNIRKHISGPNIDIWVPHMKPYVYGSYI